MFGDGISQIRILDIGISDIPRVSFFEKLSHGYPWDVPEQGPDIQVCPTWAWGFGFPDVSWVVARAVARLSSDIGLTQISM